MDYSNGKLLFMFVVAVGLSAIGAWIIAARYRTAVRALMSAPAGDLDAAAPSASEKGATLAGQGRLAPTLAANRQAGWRLTGLLFAVSLLVATSSAALQLLEAVGVAGWSPKRLAVLALVQLWPLLPTLAIVWRWSRLRLAASFVAFLAASYLLMLWRSIEPQPLQLLSYVVADVALPLLLIAPLCLGATTRAIAPWLLPPMLGLTWASMAGIDVLAYFVAQRSPWLASLASTIGASTVFVLFALLPWLVAWWPVRMLARSLGRAYADRRVSELSVQFAAVWSVQIVFVALGAASDRGLAAVFMLLPLLWIPIGFALMRRAQAPAGRPPTLLVLRVFQRDVSVLDLFDRVIERWRLSGNTVLIAGTDLVDRTLDAGDVLTFLDRRLGQRFISSASDLQARIAEFDLLPDLEGRFRINECYCRDSTWRAAFAALALRSDVVLMDLRGFQAKNEGCRHELAALAGAEHVGRVVVLLDADTDRATAAAATAAAPAQRFSWIDLGAARHVDHRRLLAALFGATTPARP